MVTAKPRATAYSSRRMGVNPKALARTGTSMTRVVRAREARAARFRALFWPFRVKMLFLWLRIFRLWTISAMERVRNAMVIPSGELAISQTPDSIKWPTK